MFLDGKDLWIRPCPKKYKYNLGGLGIIQQNIKFSFFFLELDLKRIMAPTLCSITLYFLFSIKKLSHIIIIIIIVITVIIIIVIITIVLLEISL